MTMENWNDILYECMKVNDVYISITMVYLVSWIFIGNYVLLNLFLAILLDGFDSNDIDEETEMLEEDFEIA